MKYPKDAYYLNSELNNKKQNGGEILDSCFKEMKKLLVNKEVFEVGFDFGQRLYDLKDSCKVIGGVEFDPNFGLYKKHYNLFDHGWDIRFTQLDFWSPIKKKCVITNHFLDLFNEDDRRVLLTTLKSMSEELYLNENCKLDLPKEGNIYVFANVRGYDIKSSTGTNVKKEVELPSFESLKHQLNTPVGNEKNTGENKARQSNPSGGVQWKSKF